MDSSIQQCLASITDDTVDIYTNFEFLKLFKYLLTKYKRLSLLTFRFETKKLTFPEEKFIRDSRAALWGKAEKSKRNGARLLYI